MFLDLCLHPLRIKVNGVYRYVPCGKCNVCINRKSSVWVSRIEREFMCHPFAFFVTLTYNNEHVPTLYLDRDSDNNYILVDTDSSEVVSLSDIKDFKPSSRLYVCRRKNIPYLKTKDVQDFIKRLRFYISNFELFKNGRKSILRYVYVGEYGPSTFRPHYHAIFFVDSTEVANRFCDLVHKSWKFGIADCKLADQGTAKYVARYINCLSSLPLVYTARQIRPRLTASKFPPIGSLQDTSFIGEQLFYGGYTSVSYMDTNGKIKDVPVWKYLENRLFPKIQDFSRLSHSMRVTLYSSASWLAIDDFQAFCHYMEELLDKYDTPFTKYISHLLYNDSKHDFLLNWNALKSLYYTSRRVLLQSRVFNVSLDFYVERIEKYYSTKELTKLKQFYEYQEQLSLSQNSRRALFYLYDSYKIEFDRFFNNDFDVLFLSSNFRDLLASIGFDLTETCNGFYWSKVLSECQRFKFLDTQRMSQMADKIIEKSRKTKKRNDYILSVQKDYNFNLLKDYD